MPAFTTLLRKLSDEQLSADERAQFRALITSLQARPLPENSLAQIVTFDDTLKGPSISRLSRIGYAGVDRDVFRPFQYCPVYLGIAVGPVNPEYVTRATVHASCLHIEMLVKRIGSVGNLPLGTAVRSLLVQQRVDADTRDRIERLTRVFNAAKHKMDHPTNTHLFSLEDALTAYIICRKLGVVLYPLVSLTTDVGRYDNSRTNTRSY